MRLLKKYLSAIISVCVLSLTVLSFAGVYAQEDDFTDEIKRMVEMVNEQREAVGAKPVVLNGTLTEAAMLRAEEITELFSHTRPDGNSCFTVLDDYSIGYHSCAENIAAGSPTAEATMNQWVNSSGHYKNMTSTDYSEIGVGVVYDPDSDYGYYWVQLFIDPTEPVQTTTVTTTVTTTTFTTVTTAAVTSQPTADDYNKKIQQMLSLVNVQREAAGAEPLTLNNRLCEAAMLRAEESAELFEHTRPDGNSCFTVLDDFFIGCSDAAENIAAGSSDAEVIMNDWINSPGHYSNMISEDYSEIGIGVVYIPNSEYGWYWVQLFIQPTEFVLTAADVNDDGVISVLDMTIIQKYLLKIDNNENTERLDVNKDKKINIFDLIYVKRVILCS